MSYKKKQRGECQCMCEGPGTGSVCLNSTNATVAEAVWRERGKRGMQMLVGMSDQLRPWEGVWI